MDAPGDGANSDHSLFDATAQLAEAARGGDVSDGGAALGADAGACRVPVKMTPRRFRPPWSVE
ncbi:MAG: hypothetical protein WAV38_03845 [Xanthobacteraceae bacterium]